MIRFRMISLLCFAALTGLSLGQKPADEQAKDPAWKLIGQMVGGKWVGKLGNLEVVQEFHFEQGGKMLVGKGVVGAGTPVETPMDSRFGWDPVAKKVYYVDHHSFDIVYAGHLRADGDQFVFDFRGLIGDPGHYITKAKFNGPDEYAFSMWQEKDGKEIDTHLAVTFHRVK